MKKYYVSIPFEGSLCVQVEAHNEEEALDKGQGIIESLSNDDIATSAGFGSYEVYEIK